MLFSYEGMEGMKTGFTSAAGFNLLASAHRGDKRILAVVLGGEFLRIAKRRHAEYPRCLVEQGHDANGGSQIRDRSRQPEAAR